MISELDELKGAFAALDRRVAQQHSLSLAQLKDQRISRAQRSLRPLVVGQIALLIFGLGMLLLGVTTWVSNQGSGGLFASGLILHAYGVVTMIAAGSTLSQIAQIDHAEPVLIIQRRLLKLRRWFITCGMVVGLPWWLLWIPFIACVSRTDLMAAPQAWRLINVAIGVVGLLATWSFYRWLRRPGREALRRRIDDGAAGRSIVRAQLELEDLARFEQA